MHRPYIEVRNASMPCHEVSTFNCACTFYCISLVYLNWARRFSDSPTSTPGVTRENNFRLAPRTNCENPARRFDIQFSIKITQSLFITGTRSCRYHKAAFRNRNDPRQTTIRSFSFEESKASRSELFERNRGFSRGKSCLVRRFWV